METFSSLCSKLVRGFFVLMVFRSAWSEKSAVKSVSKFECKSGFEVWRF